MAKTSKNATSNQANKSYTLKSRLKPKQTPPAAVAEMMVKGLAMNAVAAVDHSKTLGELDLTECLAALILATRHVRGGDLGDLEAILTAQAITLNAMFTQFASQSSRMTIVDQIDRFTRLALKAQGQCRATLETLAAIKNPPVFTHQANISGGPQQINNGPVLNAAPARAAIQESEPNKLLEAVVDGERVDGRTEGTTGKGHSAVATVGTLDRAAHASGKGARVPQRVPRRRTSDAPRTRERTQRPDAGAARGA